MAFDCSTRLKQYQCRECDNFQTDFLPHLRHHSIQCEDMCHDPPLHECDKCCFKTHSRYLILRHQLFVNCDSNEGNASPQTCDYCKKKFIDCQRCGHKTNTKSLDQRITYNHTIRDQIMKSVKVTETQRFIYFHCDQCSYVSKFKSNLTRHIICKHIPDDQIRRFDCNQCSYKAKFKSGLKRHMVTRHSVKYQVRNCEKPSGRTTRKCTLRGCVSNEQTPEDQVEQLIYKTASNSIAHVNNDNIAKDEVQWFQCDQCSYRSVRKTSLRDHVINKHTPEDQVVWFQCEQCSYMARSENNFRNHVDSKHFLKDKANWFYCEQCTYKTRHKFNLKEHMNYVHTTDKWFYCDQCPTKKFSKRLLNYHIKMVHSSKQEKKMPWLKCKYCDYQTREQTRFNNHVTAKHTQDQIQLVYCHKCEKISPKGHQVHYVHCDQCSYKTRFKPNLRRHVITKHVPHDKAQWFQCNLCSYKNKIKFSLKRHMRRKHNLEEQVPNCRKYSLREHMSNK